MKNAITSTLIPGADDAGAKENPLIFRDYNVHINGLTSTSTDTTKLWHSTLTSTGTSTPVIVLNDDDDYINFEGLDIRYLASSHVVLETNIDWNQCYLCILKSSTNAISVMQCHIKLVY